MSTQSQEFRPIEILLVEDNPADARLTIESMKESKIANRVTHLKDGVEALDFLHRRGAYDGSARPDLILLDLNMPKVNGREVLADIKTQPDLKRIPVVILTSSKAEEDIVRSYDLHANCYVTKPVDLDQFFRVIQSVEHFWCTVVTIPRT